MMKTHPHPIQFQLKIKVLGFTQVNMRFTAKNLNVTFTFYESFRKRITFSLTLQKFIVPILGSRVHKKCRR